MQEGKACKNLPSPNTGQVKKEHCTHAVKHKEANSRKEQLKELEMFAGVCSEDETWKETQKKWLFLLKAVENCPCN